MAIVQNLPCPACKENGHDTTGNHLMVFDDGNMLCPRSHFHRNGRKYFRSADGDNIVFDFPVDGSVKFTPKQFNALVEEGVINSPESRAIALSGMRQKDRWEVASQSEKQEMLADRDMGVDLFNQLTIRNLTTRGIKGQFAALYGVRVGLDENKQVDRHFYPVRAVNEDIIGAKCRTLPKDFRFGALGWLWGDILLFGQWTTRQVLASGKGMHTLLITGGECDAMAAQQMLTESQKGTKYEGQFFHVWSVPSGESGLKDVLNNRDAIDRFKKIIWCLDDDPAGQISQGKMMKLFKEKSYKLDLPRGMKDPNDCLMYGKHQEFVDAWWNPVSPFEGGTVRSMKRYKDKALTPVEMGLSFPKPFEECNSWWFGLRPNQLLIFGGGIGVGKTTFTRMVAFHLAEVHKQKVLVIFLENRPEDTIKAFAGYLIGKDLTAPPLNDKNSRFYREMLDYQPEDAHAAISKFIDDDMIMIGDLEGRKDIDSVMDCITTAMALGIDKFIIDNLTAFEHSKNNQNSGRSPIDETMARLGTLKDENPISIILLSHLKKLNADQVSHEEGGDIRLDHFKGSSSITAWADGVGGLRRNNQASNPEDKQLMQLQNVKSRQAGYTAGSVINTKLSLETLRYNESSQVVPTGREKPKDPPQPSRPDFNTGVM